MREDPSARAAAAVPLGDAHSPAAGHEREKQRHLEDLARRGRLSSPSVKARMPIHPRGLTFPAPMLAFGSSQFRRRLMLGLSLGLFGCSNSPPEVAERRVGREAGSAGGSGGARPDAAEAG